MLNGWQIFQTSVCCPFSVGWRMFLCTICALEHLCTIHQLNICAQTVDECCRCQFAVRLCTNGWRISWTTVCGPLVHKRLTDISERKGKFNENQENNTFKRRMQAICTRTKIHTSDSKQLTNVLVLKRLCGQIYIRLLSDSEHRSTVCCPFAVWICLLCRWWFSLVLQFLHYLGLKKKLFVSCNPTLTSFSSKISLPQNFFCPSNSQST